VAFFYLHHHRWERFTLWDSEYMAKLEITIAKDAYEALSDELKTFYVATQDGKGYELEGVGSIKRALDDEKAKRTTKPELLTELEQLRAEKAEREANADKEAQEMLVKQGEFEKAQAARDAEWQKRLDAAEAEKGSLFTDVKRERLTNELVKRGVLADRAAYLVGEMDADTELVKGDDGKYTLKKKGGIGDATEFDSLIAETKEKKPFFFAADGASGSGASGSDGTGVPQDISKMNPIELLNQANAKAAN
jgi:hypothetical protein